MKNRTVKHQILILPALFLTSFLFAQVASRYSIGINAGTFIYQGDLTPTSIGSFQTPGFVLGFTGRRFLSNVLSARLDLNFGQLKGDDSMYEAPAFRRQRAFVFKASATEVLLSAVYHPLGHDRKLSPYLMGGAGLSFTRIQKDYSRFNTEFFEQEPRVAEGLAQDNLQTLPRRIAVLPVGVGLQVRLSDKWLLHSEASYRIMSTDYLDGFSKAANPTLKDHYFKYSLGISFLLGGKSRYDCPKVK